MPKNSSNKGSKGKNVRQSSQLREREEKDGEYYADVLKPLGDGQFRVQILNGNEEIAKLKGSMRKGGRGFDKVVAGNLVLVQVDPTTTTKDKYFIIHNYDEKEKKQLEKLGELKSVVENTVSEAFIFEGDIEQNEAKVEEVDDDFINDI